MAIRYKIDPYITIAMAKSHVLGELKPVILANDEYDEDLTHLKVVAKAEFAASNDTSYVNVSHCTSVRVIAAM